METEDDGSTCTIIIIVLIGFIIWWFAWGKKDRDKFQNCLNDNCNGEIVRTGRGFSSKYLCIEESKVYIIENCR